jgi:lipid II:glycine glycyltransferase (peptidoglycan interpeptide bridge formation enzyme)
MDPGIEDGGSHSEWLRRLGWRRAKDVQPSTSRVLDLTAGEEALWHGLHRKTRQSVTKSERQGVSAAEVGDEGFDAFYAIHVEAARRAGIPHRAEQTFRDLWDAFRPASQARLFLAHRDAEPVASILLVGWGRSVVDLYGGMTQAGAATRANYLVKWEAIKTLAADGYAEYDLWGLPTPEISRFKEGFGGREVRYVGAWDLVVDPVGRAVVEGAIAARNRAARLRERVLGLRRDTTTAEDA